MKRQTSEPGQTQERRRLAQPDLLTFLDERNRLARFRFPTQDEDDSAASRQTMLETLASAALLESPLAVFFIGFSGNSWIIG